MFVPDDVPSPCISVCTMDPAAALCTGCLRTIDEIIEWGNASGDRKREIVALIDARRVAAIG